jgi:hypothetical protein
MTNAPNLLNEDGSASMATALMMSHHGLRRDLLRFEEALRKVAAGDVSKLDALREEWRSYRQTLHGHHDAEDTRLFPYLQGQRDALVPTFERLVADHRRIDPLLDRGDRAFADLPDTRAAQSVISELQALLTPHLALEEAEVIPFLRDAKAFPPPPSEEETELFAEGFAWSSHGVAPDVLARVDDMLPGVLRAKLPAAREAFTKRYERVWGSVSVTASRTPVPEGWP